MASKKKNSGKTDQSPAASIYPFMPGYQVFMPPWGPVPFASNFQYPWHPQWPSSYPYQQNHSGGYRPPCYPEEMPRGRMQPYKSGPPVTNEEYFLDSLRHIYSNDGSIEIERVKLQKVPTEVCYTTKSRPVSRIVPVDESESIYTSINITHDGTVPPPRRRKKQNQVVAQSRNQRTSSDSSQSPPPVFPPWMPPYTPYMQYPYPYPFPFGYVPPPMPPHPSQGGQLSASPDFITSPSPSDGSENPSSKDYGKSERKSRERMASPFDSENDARICDERQRELEVHQNERKRDVVGDTEKQGCQIELAKEIPKKNSKINKKVSNERRTKSLDETDFSDEISFNSKESRELVAAFKNLEETASKFKDQANQVEMPPSPDPKQTKAQFNKTELPENDPLGTGSLSSVAISIETVDPELIENELSDHTLRDIDTSLSESESDQSSSPVGDSDTYQWILKSDENEMFSQVENDDRTQPWRTEVSLWRARLIVSLCKGESFDQQDWETFQLLVQHPLAISMKLSIFNAPRFCISNSGIGVAALRNSLLHLIPYGEALLKRGDERNSSWNLIRLNESHIWTTIKGSQEIMRAFGYRRKGDSLKYEECYASEVSIIARMTLDMLVLAEEFRFYLAGNHMFPVNVTRLFTKSYTSPYDSSQGTDDCHKKEMEPSYAPPVGESSSDSMTLPTVIHRKNDSKLESEDDNQLSGSEGPSYVHEEPSLKEMISNSPSSSIPDLHSFSTGLPSLVDVDKEEKSATIDSSELSKEIDLDTPRKTKIASKNKAEDHIYEEICELRTGKASDIAPKSPPLPPKSKRNLTMLGREESSKNHSSTPDIASAIPPTKIARKKKRRAPMPPEFNSIERKCEKNTKELSPVTINKEKIDSEQKDTKKEKNANPFNEKPVPTGYVGKNPFYEDIVPPNVTKEATPSGPPYSSIKKTSQKDSDHPKQTPKIVSEPQQKKTSNDQESKAEEKKNLKEEQQCNSWVVAPANLSETKGKSKNESFKQETILKESNKLLSNPPIILISEFQQPEETKPINHKHAQEDAQLDAVKELINKQENQKEKCQMTEPAKKTCGVNKHFQRIENLQKSLCRPQVQSDKTEPNSNKSRKIVKNRKEEGSFIKITTTKSDQVKPIIIPPMPPPKAPLKIIDDIPYIDTNEVQELKRSLAKENVEGSPSPPPYLPPKVPEGSPPETPGTSPPASPVFFLRGSSETSVIIVDAEEKLDELNQGRRNSGELEVKSKEDRTISIFEERYEIPDLTQVESNLKLLSGKNYLTPNKTAAAAANKQRNRPQRPKRKIRPTQPPPRPPKPIDTKEVPPLPPKLTNFQASQWHSSSELESSSIKTAEPQNSNSLPEVCKSSPSLTNGKSNTLPATSSREASRDRATNTPRSASTPASPKARERSDLNCKHPRHGKSWSSVFCDCVYTNDSNGKNGKK